MRKRWVLVAIPATLLALGITAGITLAQSGGSGDDPPWASYASEVASILGLEEA